MQNFIWAKLRIITWEEHLRKALTLRTVLHVRSQGTVIEVFWDRGLYIKWCVNNLHNPGLSVILALIRSRRNVIFLRNYFVDARKMLLFIFERGFHFYHILGWQDFFFPLSTLKTLLSCVLNRLDFLSVWFAATNFRKILTISSDNSYVLFLLQLQLC